MFKKLFISALVIALIGTAIYLSPAMREARFVDALVAANVEARGGAAAWERVTALRLNGRMDLGQDMTVPYVLEHKRPGKMCFEFEFDGAMSTQCADGDGGWKIAPFMGRAEPQAMSDLEYQEFADAADPYGVLYDYRARGIKIDYLGLETIEERETHKLQVNLPKGGTRWVYLDAETALDIKLQTPRTIAGRDHVVETIYSDWQTSEGLLIPMHQESRKVGEGETSFLTVDSVIVNPNIEDDRFHIPAVVSTGSGNGGNPS